jgi:antitoxin VapB
LAAAESVMSLEINSAETDALARELASATGEDVETAVHRAVEERLARVPRKLDPARREAIAAVFAELRKLPVRDPRSADEIVGYGPDGLPS